MRDKAEAGRGGGVYPYRMTEGGGHPEVRLLVRPAGCPCRYAAEVWAAGVDGLPRFAGAFMGNDRTALVARAAAEAPVLAARLLVRPADAGTPAADPLPPEPTPPHYGPTPTPEPLADAGPVLENDPVCGPADPHGAGVPAEGRRSRVPVQVFRNTVPGRNRRECWAVSPEKAEELNAALARGDRPVLLMSETSGGARVVRYEMDWSPSSEFYETPVGHDGREYTLVHAGDAADAGAARRIG